MHARRSAYAESTLSDVTPTLPLPPLEMRQLVGPTDDAEYENPSGDLIFPELTPHEFAAVLDWGSGCGRIARRLIQQRPRPGRYLGLDVHAGMINWCRSNLTPRAPAFEFVHHDVFELAFNPDATKAWMPLAADDDSFTLAIAWSVFTHVTEEHARRYLQEIRRVLRSDGVLVSTWFLFDKREFPMMQSFQNALFVNDVHPTNAVIFDRTWLYEAARDAGLVVTRADPPTLRGFQWRIHLRPVESRAKVVELPDDTAPYGSWTGPPLPSDAYRIGRV